MPYYHATPARNIPSILKRGLIVHGSNPWWTYFEDQVHHKAIYLSKTLRDAEGWAYDISESTGEPTAIFQVTPSSRPIKESIDPRDLDEREMIEYYAYENIPPKRLKLIKVMYD